MGRVRYIYRETKDGSVRALPVKKVETRKDPDYDTMGFHSRIMRSYYEVECGKNGYRGGYAKNTIKRVHENAIARGE